MNKKLIQNLATGFVAFAAVSASAPSFAEDGFYIGAGVSQAFVDERGLDDDDTGGKVFGGYRINEYFAVEASYYDFGENEELGSNLELDGVSLAVVGSLPVTNNISLLAKVGAHDWDAEARGPIASQLSDDSDGDAFYGVGAQYTFANSLSVRAEVERYEVEDFDIDVATISVHYNF